MTATVNYNFNVPSANNFSLTASFNYPSGITTIYCYFTTPSYTCPLLIISTSSSVTNAGWIFGTYSVNTSSQTVSVTLSIQPTSNSSANMPSLPSINFVQTTITVPSGQNWLIKGLYFTNNTSNVSSYANGFGNMVSINGMLQSLSTTAVYIRPDIVPYWVEPGYTSGVSNNSISYIPSFVPQILTSGQSIVIGADTYLKGTSNYTNAQTNILVPTTTSYVIQGVTI